MRRLLPAAGLAAALHGLLFLAGDFGPDRAGALNSRPAGAVTIRLLEPRFHSYRPAPESPDPEPERQAYRTERPGVVFDSTRNRPKLIQALMRNALPVAPRALSTGPAPAKRPVIMGGLPAAGRSKRGGPSESTPESPKGTPGGKPLSSPPLVEAVPLYRENPTPVYPELARRRGYEGVVILEVMVTKEGRVNEFRVAISSGHAILDRAAEQTVREWRFEPGKRGNRPVAMKVRIPVRFRLQ